MDTLGASRQFPVPWEALRAWLQEAELTQIKTGSTAHISPTQLLALSQFVTFVEEPEVPSDNYVSKLQGALVHCSHRSGRETAAHSSWLIPYATAEFVQKRHLDMPQFTMESLNVPVAGKYRPRWRCICSLPWSGEKFPEPGEGDIGLFVNSKVRKSLPQDN